VMGTVADKLKEAMAAATTTKTDNPSPVEVYNHVSSTHVTASRDLINLGPLIGRVSYSTTVTTYHDKDPALVYSFADVGNDSMETGYGLNLFGAFGVAVGLGTEGYIYLEFQLTPWFHIGSSIGKEGVGYSLGFDYKDHTSDIEIQIGWGSIVTGIVIFGLLKAPIPFMAPPPVPVPI